MLFYNSNVLVSGLQVTEPDSNSNGLSEGDYAGAVIGVAAGFLFITLLCYFLVTRSSQPVKLDSKPQETALEHTFAEKKKNEQAWDVVSVDELRKIEEI